MCARGSNPALLRGPSTSPLDGLNVGAAVLKALLEMLIALVLLVSAVAQYKTERMPYVRARHSGLHSVRGGTPSNNRWSGPCSW